MWLQEVAGTRVYDERKEESAVNIKETDAKREKIDSLLKYIEDRLTTLEAEKEELKEYQKWDKMRRSVEFTLYEQEQRDNRAKELKLQTQREEVNAKKDQLIENQASVHQDVNRVKRERRDLEARFAGLKDDRDALNAEQTELFQTKTKLDLKVKDLNVELKAETDELLSNQKLINAILADIATRKDELDAIGPRWEEARQKEANLETQIAILQAQRAALYSKQGAADRWASKEERDTQLKAELRQLERQMAQERDSLDRLRRDAEAEEEEATRLRDALAQYGRVVEAKRGELDELAKKTQERRAEKEAALAERRELWRMAQQGEVQRETLKEELATAEHHLQQKIGFVSENDLVE